jgi:DNA primase
MTLRKQSGRHVGLCPFHAEKTPSFHVFSDHYYCFGCKAKGDIIDFVRQTKGMGFIEALKYLTQKYGVEAPELEISVSIPPNASTKPRRSN